MRLDGSRVLFLCTTDNMIWQFLVPHIQDLVSLGASVDCACNNTGFWFEDLKAKGLNMIELPFGRGMFALGNIKAYSRLKQLVKNNKYDFIFCQQSVASVFARLVGKKYNIPVIYTVHGFAFAEGNNPIKNIIYKTVEKYLSRYTDIMITMNDYDYSVAKLWNNNVYKISGIGLYDRNAESFITREDLGLTKDDRVVMSISEFIKRKNYPTMIKAFYKLTKKYNNLKYVICGTGKDYKKINKLAKKLGIIDKIKFLGYRRDAVDILKVADIFYHESFNEGLTMSIMEAMRAGLPVITSNRRGNVDLVDNGYGGFVTEPKDIDGQVSAISKLLDNDEMRINFGEYNKEKVKEYSLDKVREEMLSIYKKNALI